LAANVSFGGFLTWPDIAPYKNLIGALPSHVATAPFKTQIGGYLKSFERHRA